MTYQREAIDWSYIEFMDNQECLDLLEKKPMCILSILDEECRFPKANCSTFTQKLNNNFSSHPNFERPRFGKNQFIVHHYAGPVTYFTETFIEKNKDFVVHEHVSLMQN